MITIKQIFRIAIVFSLFTFFCLSKAKGDERMENFVKVFQLSAQGELKFTTYDADLKVKTWDRNEVKVQGVLIIKEGDADDQEDLIEAFKAIPVAGDQNSLSIDTKFYKSITVVGFIKKTTLITEKSVPISKFKANYTIWIPKSVNFVLQSKYNEIDIEELSGQLDFDLHDVDLKMEGFKDNFSLKAKYSDVAIGKGRNAQVEMYDGELKLKDIDKLLLDSKYSEIKLGKAKEVKLVSYDDEIYIENIQVLNTSAKYSNYEINSDMSEGRFELYDSDVSAKNINDLIYSAKYSELDAGNVEKLFMNTLYDSDIELKHVSEFSCSESKYDEIRFESIRKNMQIFSAYDSQVEVGVVEKDFESFTGDFKYGSVKLDLSKQGIDYQLEFDTKYGSVNYDKERFKGQVTSIKENSGHKFKGATKEGAKCKVKFTAYSTTFLLD